MEDVDNVDRSLYDILGVSSVSSTNEIKLAYREKLLSTHPDKVGGDFNQIDEIKQAYNVLKDDTLRQEYDKLFSKATKKHGFNANGDGLDLYNLDDFETENLQDELYWYRDCPRCHASASITLTERDLESLGTSDGSGGYHIIVQCQSCSLWIKVEYQEEEDEE